MSGPLLTGSSDGSGNSTVVFSGPIPHSWFCYESGDGGQTWNFVFSDDLPDLNPIFDVPSYGCVQPVDAHGNPIGPKSNGAAFS